MDTGTTKGNKRKSAFKVFVKDILNSTYIKRPGWEPSGILTQYGEVSRVSLMGIIVSIENEGSLTYIIDDGTGSIQLRFFEDPKAQQERKVGELIYIIGRPREAGDLKYIVPEILKKIDNKTWFRAFQLEVRLQKKTSPIRLPVNPEEGSGISGTGPYQKILNAIAVLDTGDGADVEDIITNVKIEGCEKIISSLLAEGEIFEIAPGKVKVLE